MDRELLSDEARKNAPTYKGDNLIFIISQPRSGSTLLQRVLAGHPDIQTSAETWLMLHPLYGDRRSGMTTEYGQAFRVEAVEEFLDNYADNDGLLDDANRAWAKVIYDNVLAKGERKLFLDKTPRYFFIIPELVRLFPDAKFIFLLRNPMAVLASELNTYVKGDWPVLGVFAPDLVDAPRLILNAMTSLGDNAISVRYESFVKEPEIELKALCNKLDITYHKEMIEYVNTPAPVGKMNDPVGIHQHTRPSASSIDRWMSMADAPQHAHFAQAYLRELGPATLSELGYDYEVIKQSLGEEIDDRTRQIFPWHIAITPRENWNLRERFRAERYLIARNKGWLRGTLSTIKTTAKRLIKGALASLRYAKR